VVAGGKSTSKPHEAWIAVDPRGIVRVLMTGPMGLNVPWASHRTRTPPSSPRWYGLRWTID
jgi:hypothetical protein